MGALEMSLFSAARGLWWVASEVVDAARQLVAFTPGQDDYRAHLADVLAEKEAREEVAEPTVPFKHVPEVCRLHRDPMCPHCDEELDELWVHPDDLEAEAAEAQDDCGLGGDVVDFYDNEDYYIPPCCRPGGRCTGPSVSAAPGVSPVEAADKDPGVSHSPTPGSQTSSEPSEERPAPAVEEGTASSSSPSLDGPLGGASDSRSLNISGAGHLTSLTADEMYMAAVGAHWYAESALDVRWSAYRDLGYKLHDIASQMPSLTLGNDPAAVHDRAMRQRHNEDREQS